MASEYPDLSTTVLVTGASGFVGAALVRRLKADSYPVYSAIRTTISAPNVRQAPNLSTSANWRPLLHRINVVVHTAARVHTMNDNAKNPLAVFRDVNVAGTLTLARQAAEAGVRRFVFISSIKVNGEITAPGTAFSTNDIPLPIDPYGISKAEAEAGLRQIASETGMQLVIIRPPLVYGPGVKANFQSMMRWLQRGIPLPFGGIQNKRSLVALDNLVDLITICIDHPAASNQTFLAADGDDMSTPELLHRAAVALNTTAKLFFVPMSVLTCAAHLVGRPAIAQRLCSSLQVDISSARSLLGWQPPLTVDEGLRQTAQSFNQII
jgi:nucleoside-diphosphate-sugar epimerase